MPTPREQLDIDIDAILNDAVPNQSLKPSDEGDAIKLVGTYAESLVVSKVKKTTITSAQILNIFTNPIEIVPAIAGKIILPTNIVIIIKFNSSTYTDVGGAWKIVFGTSGLTISTISSYLGSATYDKETIQTLFYNAATTFGTFINQPLNLTTTGNNPIGGNSNIDVYVTYNEITL